MDIARPWFTDQDLSPTGTLMICGSPGHMCIIWLAVNVLYICKVLVNYGLLKNIFR